MKAKYYITKSKSGHYTVTVRGIPGPSKIGEQINTIENARRIVAEHKAARAN